MTVLRIRAGESVLAEHRAINTVNLKEFKVMLPLQQLFEQEIAGVPSDISSNDLMYNTDPRYYFFWGQQAMKSVRLAMLVAGKTAVRKILDLPCGHGRVLRTLKAAFPDAE